MSPLFVIDLVVISHHLRNDFCDCKDACQVRIQEENAEGSPIK